MVYLYILEVITLPVRDCQKKAAQKWDKKNMQIVACKIKKEQAERFKKYATENNTTPNALLREYVFKCIHEENE